MLILAKKIGDITTDDIAGAIPLFLAICVGIMIISWAILKTKNKENAAMPVEGMLATIVDMPKMEANAIVIATWILIEFPNGNRKRLSCKGNHNFVVGDYGYAKWQGTKLVSFERIKE